MTVERPRDAVFRLLRLLAERLESFVDGDDLALETLGESIEEGNFSVDEVQAAILVLRRLGGEGPGEAFEIPEKVPGKESQRVLSAEERASLSPEAWGYLLDLKRRGSLNPEQFERVLDLLAGCGVRPVDVELAREVATRVALKFDPDGSQGDTWHGDFELTH